MRARRVDLRARLFDKCVEDAGAAGIPADETVGRSTFHKVWPPHVGDPDVGGDCLCHTCYCDGEKTFEDMTTLLDYVLKFFHGVEGVSGVVDETKLRLKGCETFCRVEFKHKHTRQHSKVGGRAHTCQKE